MWSGGDFTLYVVSIERVEKQYIVYSIEYRVKEERKGDRLLFVTKSSLSPFLSLMEEEIINRQARRLSYGKYEEIFR